MVCASVGCAAGAWKGEAMQPKLKLAPEQVKKPKEKDTTPSVWNPNWKYKPGGTAMDLAEKFKRIRKQMIEDEQAKKMRRVK
jgi:hypothetical protein